jgi:hypothetical protein
MTTTTQEEIKYLSHTEIGVLFPKENRSKQVTVSCNVKSPSSVVEGKRQQEKTIGGIFSYTNKLGELVDRCFYDKTDGSPQSPLVINGTMLFDLKKPIDFANYMMLKEYLDVNPDAKFGIEITDEQANNEANITDRELKHMITDRLLRMKKDSEGLKKMYRRLMLGGATGLTTEIVYGKLLDLIEVDYAKVARYFEGLGDPRDAAASLIDLARERGLVANKGGFHTIVGTGMILGESFDSAVMRVMHEPSLKEDIQKMIDNKGEAKAGDYVEKKAAINQDFWTLEDTLSKSPLEESADGNFHLELNDEKAMDLFISNLVKNKIVILEKTKYSSDTLPFDGFSKSEVVSAFKNNANLLKTAKAYLNN